MTSITKWMTHDQKNLFLCPDQPARRCFGCFAHLPVAHFIPYTLVIMVALQSSLDVRSHRHSVPGLSAMF